MFGDTGKVLKNKTRYKTGLVNLFWGIIYCQLNVFLNSIGDKLVFFLKSVLND